MKKQAIIVAAVMMASVAGSWAQTTNDQLILSIPLTFSGKLSGASSAKVTDATLGGSLVFAEVQFVRSGVTGTPTAIIGSGITLSTVTNGSGTNTVLSGNALWASDDTVDLSKSNSKTFKGISSFGQIGESLADGTEITNLDSIISNSVLLVTSTISGSSKKTNFTAQATGIWIAGSTSVKGTFKTAK